MNYGETCNKISINNIENTRLSNCRVEEMIIIRCSNKGEISLNKLGLR